jgi:hypothetical protein
MAQLKLSVLNRPYQTAQAIQQQHAADSQQQFCYSIIALMIIFWFDKGLNIPFGQINHLPHNFLHDIGQHPFFNVRLSKHHSLYPAVYMGISRPAA